MSIQTRWRTLLQLLKTPHWIMWYDPPRSLSEGSRSGRWRGEVSDTGAFGPRSPTPEEQPAPPPQKIDLYPPHNSGTYTDFDKKYPPDRHSEEAGANARVWRVYRDRVTELDEDLVQGWNATLDVILIFVRWSLLGRRDGVHHRSGKALQHDYAQYTAVGVFAVLAALNGTVTAPGSLPDFDRVPTTTRSRLVNGLWFASLTLALVDALLAILVKQWLVEYASRMRQPAADARQWVWRHYAFREGLTKWGVGVVISALAALLHVALFLFLSGLLTYLFDLDHAICAFYLIATLAPLWYGDCPSITPLLRHMRRVCLWLWDTTICITSRSASSETERPKRPPPVYDGNFDAPGEKCLRDAKALAWMIQNLVTPADMNVAVEAIGSQDIFDYQVEFPRVHQPDNPLSQNLVGRAVEQRVRSLIPIVSGSGTNTEKASLALAIRSMLFIRWPIPYELKELAAPLSKIRSFDLHLLERMMDGRVYSRTPKSNWLHPNTLELLQTWRASWGSDGPEPIQAICSLTLDLLLSDIASFLSPGTGHLSVSNVSTLAMVSQWVPLREVQLKTLAHIGQMALLVRSKAPASLNLDATDPWHVSAMTTWGHFIENAAAYAISEQVAEQLISGYRLFVARAFPSGCSISIVGTTSEASLSLQQLERCLRCISSPAMERSNDRLVLATMAAKLQTQWGAGQYHWSRKLGDISFFIMQQLSRSNYASEDLARMVDTVVSRVWGTRDSPVNIMSCYATISEHIHETTINLLVPSPAQLSAGLWQFSHELALLAQLVTAGSMENSDNFILRHLLDQLTGADHGVSLAINHTADLVHLAKHGKIVSSEWWLQLQEDLLGIPEHEWNAYGPKWRYDLPRDLVDEIEHADPCGDGGSRTRAKKSTSIEDQVV
ncbi:hypothetical protein BKA62DRAFT_834674 [Auriculariales sp. MPI-PUGE-AT-0066]|nr:hypothetical protein BKA62DRAFT_834674 [Auriculariales sp. MPI-PUGE-AT-0066]